MGAVRKHTSFSARTLPHLLTVFSFLVGMAQVWYVGPIGALIGPPPYGGDIGFELSGSFAAVSYPVRLPTESFRTI